MISSRNIRMKVWHSSQSSCRTHSNISQARPRTDQPLLSTAPPPAEVIQDNNSDQARPPTHPPLLSTAPPPAEVIQDNNSDQDSPPTHPPLLSTAPPPQPQVIQDNNPEEDDEEHVAGIWSTAGKDIFPLIHSSDFYLMIVENSHKTGFFSTRQF